VIDEYLALLGVARRPPSIGYLFELHRAHVSRVPYTNVQIMRGRPASIDPLDAVRQILDGNGGYCFQLNSGFSWLLRELGFCLTLHRGYALRHGESSAELNHLALVVHDLEERMWFADAGLGDGLYEPLPLATGHYRQGPFVYGLEFTGTHWRFTHDELGSFAYLDFEPAAAALGDFAEAHRHLSTAPQSPLTRFLTAQVRLADRVSIVRACTATLLDSAGKHESQQDSPQDFARAYAEARLSNVDDLWEHSRMAHVQWLASL
jgi:arylamine N-acetyltransferase